MTSQKAKTPLYWRHWLQLERKTLTKKKAKQFLNGDLGRALAHQPPRFYIGIYKLWKSLLTDDEIEHTKVFLRASVHLEPLVLAALKVLKRKRPELA